MMRLQSFRSVYGIVSKYIKNEYLRVVLSFHPLLIGGNPFATTSIYSLISFLERNYGVYSAVGGTGSIVQGLADLARGQGVEFQFDAEVAAIEVTGGRTTGVTLRNGQKIAADIVVSNADAAWTYKHLLPAKFRGRWGERRLQRAKYSNGLFVWYFGTNRRYDDIAHHSIVLGPRYRGLLDDIFDNKSLSSDFSLYLHRPTATDPSMAPQGCDAFYALSPVPNLDGNVDWQEVAEDYRAAIERRLEEKLLPGLKDAVVESRVTTPLDFEQQLCAYRGAGFSLQPLLTQSAWFRPHNRSKDVEGLFFVGAGTHPGAGIPGVLSSAKILESVIPHASQFH
jgi:phytoene desaturase